MQILPKTADDNFKKSKRSHLIPETTSIALTHKAIVELSLNNQKVKAQKMNKSTYNKYLESNTDAL